MESKVTVVKIVDDEEIEYVITALNASDDEEVTKNDDNKITDVVVKQLIDKTQELCDAADGQTHNQKMCGFSLVEHVCGKCDQIFTVDTFKKHILSCKRTTSCFCCKEDLNIAHQGGFPCLKCDLKFHTKLGRQQHIFSLHAEDSEFKCKSCYVVCPTRVLLDLHMRTHANRNTCEKCGYKFTDTYYLKHLKQNACSRESGLKAAYNSTFTDISPAILDRTTEPSKKSRYSKQRIFQCSYCDKSFGYPYLLRYHVSVHIGEKRFPCNVCGQAFGLKASLRNHRRKHIIVKPFTCPTCRRSFNTRRCVNRHFKTHHTGAFDTNQSAPHTDNTDRRSFVCSICQKVFYRLRYLLLHKNSVHYADERSGKSHMAVLDEAKNFQYSSKISTFKCDLCKNEFTTHKKLLTHLCVSDPKGPYICVLCNNGYRRLDNLMRHTSAVHPEAHYEIVTKDGWNRLKFLNLTAEKNTIVDVIEPIKQESEDEEVEIDYSYIDYDDDDDKAEIREINWLDDSDN